MSDKRIGKTTRTLVEAKALIEDPANWCTFRLKNKQGQMCALGAVISAGGWSRPALRVLNRAALKLYGERAVDVNNKRGHAATMQTFDRAITLSMKADGTDD